MLLATLFFCTLNFTRHALHKVATNLENQEYSGISQKTQGILREFCAIARLVTGTRRCEHITPVLRQLHWSPVRQRIQYKLASLAFRALSGLAPDYLAGDCQLVADFGRRSLQSAEQRVYYVPCQNSTFGDRSFAAAGPRTSVRVHRMSCRSIYVTLGYR